jgi:NAD(P)-dependent dehydrogenase (short-subunit alcohol dehydrogenase family)
VLGGTSGIGAAIADIAQHNGARVTIASRRPSPSIDLADRHDIDDFFKKDRWTT